MMTSNSQAQVDDDDDLSDSGGLPGTRIQASRANIAQWGQALFEIAFGS